MSTPSYAFASDNTAAIDPHVLTALQNINHGYAASYGEDELTQSVSDQIQALLGQPAQTFLLTNGTATNTLAMIAMMKSHHAIICDDKAHINHHECGSIEKLVGAKIYPVYSHDHKLTPALIASTLEHLEFPHSNLPKVIAITQATEYGLVYSLAEIREIVNLAHQHHCYVYLDGARLANACAYLNCSLKEMISDLKIDAFTFGGTKNGLLAADALIFLNAELAQEFAFIQKQHLQLLSKMRFLSAQFHALLQENRWLTNAAHANGMAHYLADQLLTRCAISPAFAVEANMVFAKMPKILYEKLQQQYVCYAVDPHQAIIRLVCSFSTTKAEVDQFICSLERSAA
ncbi:MAG: aminotransferase class I/II-fold pyridoxal phosphate-dependent enzyme [Legionellales bacterium]|nr:aminotransferase class I/II-fold pyridoxal phosphate-dependent enzyme [Legionellales bacterium]